MRVVTVHRSWSRTEGSVLPDCVHLLILLVVDMTVRIKTLGKVTERKRNPPYGMSESFIRSGTSSRLWDPDDYYIAHRILTRFILKPTPILSCLFLKKNFINIFPPASSSPKRFCFPVSRPINCMYVLLMSLCDAGHVYFIIFESITVTVFAIAPHRIWRSSLAFIKTHTRGSFIWETFCNEYIMHMNMRQHFQILLVQFYPHICYFFLQSKYSQQYLSYLMPPILIVLSTRSLGLSNIKYVEYIFDRV